MMIEIKYKGKRTAPNRTVYASLPSVARATKNRSRPYGLCAVFLRHILARRNAAHCFIGGPKRRKQPERYAKFGMP
jgi:hypothetical protein